MSILSLIFIGLFAFSSPIFASPKKKDCNVFDGTQKKGSSALNFFLDLLEKTHTTYLSADTVYKPHIFVEETTQAGKGAFGLGMRMADLEHDFSTFILTMLSMIVQYDMLKASHEQSPILKPTTFKGTYLLAQIQTTFPSLSMLRAISIDEGKIVVSFTHMLDVKKIDTVLESNNEKYPFTKKTFITSKKQLITSYYLNNNLCFSIGNHVAVFPYREIYMQAASDIMVRLEIFTELVGVIQSKVLFLENQIIFYHDYAELFKEIMQEGYVTHVLSTRISDIMDLSAFGENVEASILHVTKKSEGTGNSKYAVADGLKPTHITYILFIPKEEKFVIGLDTLLDYPEIQKRIDNKTFFKGTGYSNEILEIRTTTGRSQTQSLKYTGNKWEPKTSPEYDYPKHVFINEEGRILLDATLSTISIRFDTYQEQQEIINAILDSIYDNKLFYTDITSNARMKSALTPSEREIITAIKSLCQFYLYFGVMADHTAHFRAKTQAGSDIEWLLEEIRKAPQGSFNTKVVYVINRVIEMGKDDIPMILANNERAREFYKKMLEVRDALSHGGNL